MISIIAPKGALRRRLPFYLALEEWVVSNMPADEYFFTWQAGPAVICGRNQDVSLEVDLDYCRKHGIEVCRRKSGGGCVFSGINNIMTSYIAPQTHVESVFSHYTSALAQALVALGLDAKATGRNDLEIDGRKVSGNAFYLTGGRSIVHGTMLFKVDGDMYHAITPSRAKLASKKVVSVQNRVAGISDYLPELTIPHLMSHLHESLCTESVTIPDDALPQIEAIEKEYYSPQWLALGGHRRRADALTLPGVGTIGVEASVGEDGRILSVDIAGDFFDAGGLDNALAAAKGLYPQCLADALCKQPQAITGLENSQLAQLINNHITQKPKNT